MFSSLEVRSPYLNHNIYEFVKNFSTKALFKNDTNLFLNKLLKISFRIPHKTKKDFLLQLKNG